MKYFLILILFFGSPAEPCEPIKMTYIPVSSVLISWSPDSKSFLVEHKTMMDECLMISLLDTYFQHACDSTKTLEECIRRLEELYQTEKTQDSLQKMAMPIKKVRT